MSNENLKGSVVSKTRIANRWSCRVATGVRLVTAVVVAALSWIVIPLPLNAQGQDGFYLRGDFGDSDALTVRGSIEGVDQPTRCDRLLHPDAATIPRDPACSGVASGVLATVEFDRGAETMTSATAFAVGYSRGWLRLEAELSNTVLGATSAPLLDVGRLAPERVNEWSAVEQPRARISGFNVTDMFANVLLDFNNSSRFTPFVGVGGGVSNVILVFDGLRVRRTLADGFAPAGGVDPAVGRRNSCMADTGGGHDRCRVAPSGRIDAGIESDRRGGVSSERAIQHRAPGALCPLPGCPEAGKVGPGAKSLAGARGRDDACDFRPGAQRHRVLCGHHLVRVRHLILIRHIFGDVNSNILQVN